MIFSSYLPLIFFIFSEPCKLRTFVIKIACIFCKIALDILNICTFFDMRQKNSHLVTYVHSFNSFDRKLDNSWYNSYRTSPKLFPHINKYNLLYQRLNLLCYFYDKIVLKLVLAV